MGMTFLDTNVSLDFLGNRSPWHKEAEKIFRWHVKSTRKLSVSVITVSTLSYLLKRYHETVNVKDALLQFFQITELLDVNDRMIINAVESSWSDIEDAIQYKCALYHQATCIITRNKKDFKLAEIPVFHPVEWIEEFM
jgi:predicted nucleic acid-binding protein